jgi:hypothetical protein
MRYYTIIDAEIIEKIAKILKTSARLDLPVTVTLTAINIMPLNKIANSGIKNGNGYQQSIKKNFVTPGEQIYAIQYRKLSFK